MKWDIYLKKIVTDELIDGDDSGLQNIGLVIKGYYDDWIWDEGI